MSIRLSFTVTDPELVLNLVNLVKLPVLSDFVKVGLAAMCLILDHAQLSGHLSVQACNVLFFFGMQPVELDSSSVGIRTEELSMENKEKLFGEAGLPSN